MQTFLPEITYGKSAEVLDNRRLGKQRVECKQIYLALTDPTYGWKNHPAVKMWKGWEYALCVYGEVICIEWCNRGFKDTLLEFFQQESSRVGRGLIYPSWYPSKVDDFILSHRSNLIRKFPEHYRKFWPDVPDNLLYIWPKGRE